MKIKSRKELKGLLDWYDELMVNKNYNRRKTITNIYQNYKSTTFNEE